MELPVIARLKKELADLKYELNVRLPKELEAARAHGDLSENAEYEAAKARQDYVRSRIGQLEGRVRELSMYNISSIPRDVVAYGSRGSRRWACAGGQRCRTRTSQRCSSRGLESWPRGRATAPASRTAGARSPGRRWPSACAPSRRASSTWAWRPAIAWPSSPTR